MAELPGRGEWLLSNPLFGDNPPFAVLTMDFENRTGTVRYLRMTTSLAYVRSSAPGKFVARYVIGVNHGWLEAVYHADQTLTIEFLGTVETTCTARPVNVFLPRILDDALTSLQTEALNFGTRLIQDSNVRQKYLSAVQKYSNELVKGVNKGELTAAAAAEQANAFRNSIMESSRLSSSDIGRAIAQQIKSKGKTLAELMEYYAGKKFGKAFSSLGKAEQDQVYLAIVESAGRANSGVSASAARWGRVGRGLVLITIAIAIYNISTSDNAWRATAREGAGLAGGMAVGAGAGLATGWATGPGYPVVVGVSVFIGGVIGAFGADYLFDEVWPDD